MKNTIVGMVGIELVSELERHLRINSYSDDEIKARRIIERIKQLTVDMEMISENKRK